MARLNAEDRKRVNECLLELNVILDNYSLGRRAYLGLIFVVAMIVWLVLTLAIGFWGTILFAIIFIPLSAGTVNKEADQDEKQTAYDACVLMQTCMNIIDNAKSDFRVDIVVIRQFGNLDLYNQFVKEFPQMRSAKLRTLAKIKFA